MPNLLKIAALIEKLKSIQADKKEIMTRHIDSNLNSLKKVYLENVIAGSNYYLDDFNWNVNVRSYKSFFFYIIKIGLLK